RQGVAGCGCALCAGFEQRCHLAERAVPDGHLIAGLEQAPGHGCPHESKSEIAEPLDALRVYFARISHRLLPSVAPQRRAAAALLYIALPTAKPLLPAWLA